MVDFQPPVALAFPNLLALRGHAGQPGPRAENRERGSTKNPVKNCQIVTERAMGGPSAAGFRALIPPGVLHRLGEAAGGIGYGSSTHERDPNRAESNPPSHFSGNGIEDRSSQSHGPGGVGLGDRAFGHMLCLCQSRLAPGAEETRGQLIEAPLKSCQKLPNNRSSPLRRPPHGP